MVAAPLPSFGIVAEGPTDQVVIKRILVGFFAEDGEEPPVVRIQPPPREPGKDDPPGGWGLVFRFFQDGRHRKALQAVDYLVIHIDTDVSEQAGYDVPWRESGRELKPVELAARVADKIAALVDDAFLAAYGHRLLFAVAVHSIECWLLPLLYDDHHAAKIAGCAAAANDALRRRNEPPLSKETRGGDSKDPRAYDAVSRGYLKRKKLAQGGEKNPSLGVFLKKLDAVKSAHLAASPEPDRSPSPSSAPSSPSDTPSSAPATVPASPDPKPS